jgi:hypothetical protein
MIAVHTDTVSMEHANVSRDMKEKIVQEFQDLKKVVQNHVFHNAFNFAHTFIKQRD